MKREELKAIREAVADYIYSEGCDCCRGSDHTEDEEVLAKLLKVKKYEDGSGYDFYRYSPKRNKGKASNLLNNKL